MDRITKRTEQIVIKCCGGISITQILSFIYNVFFYGYFGMLTLRHIMYVICTYTGISRLQLMFPHATIRGLVRVYSSNIGFHYLYVLGELYVFFLYASFYIYVHTLTHTYIGYVYTWIHTYKSKLHPLNIA